MQTKMAVSGHFKRFRIPIRQKNTDDFNNSSVMNENLEFANEILSGVVIAEYKQLLPHLQIVSLRAGQQLFAEGERNDYVYFPETCVVSHVYNLSDGNTIEIATIGSEGISGICALFGSRLNTYQAKVTIGGNACRIKAKVLFQTFSNGGRLQKLLLDYFNQYINQVSQRVICQSFHAVEKRLSSWLLMLDDRTQNKRLTITHEQISLILGVHRPTVSNIAKSLRDAGLIKYSRGNVEIINRHGLENLACECYSIAHIYYYDK